MNTNRGIWLEQGYIIFAYKGVQELKIERLAKDVGKNKSSFYHYFASNEVLITEMLSKHIERIQLMAVKLQTSKNLAHLIQVLVVHKTDLLFNRQLRIDRRNKEFQECFQKTNEIVRVSILDVWQRIFGLENNSRLAKLLLKFSVENFFLSITEENLNKQWLNDYFKQLQEMVNAFKKMSTLDGTV